jgi:tetratricopeptide (TPR) repeat protein
MLADLLRVPLASIRRWHRRGLIVPAHEVHRLPYFDYQEVATARQLANLLASGMSASGIEQKLQALGRFVHGVDRSLRQLAVIVEGRQLLLRHGDGLVEPSGQRRFDFDESENRAAHLSPGAARGPRNSWESATEEPGGGGPPSHEVPAGRASVADLLEWAAAQEESGQLVQATEYLRASLAAGGPDADICFQLAELLYRLGDLAGARERYYMAIELNEDFVEARASLGCVLAEAGELELAVAAFEGALCHHPHYADAHYHLARTLGELGREAEARGHWESFLGLAPNSPWAEQAREWLGVSAEDIPAITMTGTV